MTAQSQADAAQLDDLAKTLSVDQKAALVAGASYWWTHGVPEIGLLPLQLSDGPSGVRSDVMDERHPSRCVPCGTALAASWDVDLVCAVGQLLGEEARRRGVHVLLGPTINIHRSPLGGRGFECLSEDPQLSGLIAAGYVRGVQTTGVAATAKHFVCNDAESRRTKVDNVVDERALREIYMVPFEHAVRAGAWAVMTGYNKVNGQYCSAHEELVARVLKGEWGWDGVAVSDWYANGDTAGSATAGLDLEMPGPPRLFGPVLADAVRDGRVAEADLDDKVIRLLRLASRVGRLTANPPVASGHQPERLRRGDADELLAEAAASAMVVLKNDRRLLPLARPVLGRMLVIGPNAIRPSFQGGGSAEVVHEPAPNLLEAISARLDDAVELAYEPGCRSPRQPPGLHLLNVQPVHRPGAHGLTVDYYLGDPYVTGTPTTREIRDSSRLVWLDGPPGGHIATAATVRVSTIFTPVDAGAHTFVLRGSGTCSLLVDGEKVVSFAPDDHTPLGVAFNEEDVHATVSLDAHMPVLVEIEMVMIPDSPNLLSFDCLPPQPPDDVLIDRAARAAADADIVVLVVGTTSAIETEGADRTTTALPGAQNELVTRMLEANPDTIIVVNSGAVADMPWADDAVTILYTWFPGAALGPALADVLTGTREPSGRLPITIARRHADYPAWDTTPDNSGQLHYSESIFIGHRHFDAADIEPQFCFGHGLGYGEFDYEQLTLSTHHPAADDPVSVDVTIRNTGQHTSKEIVQVYVHDRQATVARPPRELKGFTTVTLAPGQAETVKIELDSRAFAFWDDTTHAWVVEPGTFEIQVGRSSRDIRLTAEVNIHVDRDGEAR